MKTIIAGSRSIRGLDLVSYCCDDFFSRYKVKEIVSGGAPGVDRLGELVGHSLGIPITVFKASWEVFGKRAGMLRNQDMANYANALIAIWDGVSPGTREMIKMAKRGGLIVCVYNEHGHLVEEYVPDAISDIEPWP